MSFTGTITFFVYIWLLSDFWNFTLVIAFLAITLIATFSSKILLALIGPGEEDESYYNHVNYFAYEYGKSQPITVLIILGVVYFKNEIPSQEGTLIIIRYFVILSSIASLLLISPLTFNQLLSKNIDEDTRTRTAIQRFTGIFSTAIWLALLLWAFNFASGSGYPIPVGNSIEFRVSPVFMAILLSFMGVTLFIPYMIGAQLGKKWRYRLSKKKQTFLSELEEILAHPKFDILKLQRLEAKIEDEKYQFIEKDKWISWAMGIELYEAIKRGEKDETADLMDDATHLELMEMYSLEAEGIDIYKQSRNTDVRFKYLDFLAELLQEIKDMILEFENKKKPKTAEYAHIYHQKKEEITEQIKEEESRNPQIYTIVFFLVSAIVSQIFSSFGQWAWNSFTKTSG
jgi:hypothetical protein